MADGLIHGHDAEHLRKLPYTEFLKTDYWRGVSKLVRVRDGDRCRVCNSGVRVEVHHRTYANHGNEHLNLGDLTSLCRACHERHHFPPPPQVVVKTVVNYQPTPKQRPSKGDRRFFRRAAERLSIKAKNLAKLGRPAVELMLANQRPKADLALPRIGGKVVIGDIDAVEAEMPPGDPIILTHEVVKKCRANGSFTNATIEAFGLNPKQLVHGWAKELYGKSVPRAMLLQAMRGRHLYSPATIKKHGFTPCPANPPSAQSTASPRA